MLRLIALSHSYAAREDGATSIEYGLIAVGVAVAIAAIVFILGGDVKAQYTEVEAVLK